jgi:hypothetical protein
LLQVIALRRNQEFLGGDVYEKDFGPDTVAAARKLKLFDPDSSWRRVDAE